MITRKTSMDWARQSRPGIDYVTTRWGDLRVRQEGTGEKVVVFIPDAPAIIEHHDEIFTARPEEFTFLSIEPIGTGFSLPDDRFDFSFEQFAESLLAVIEARTNGPVTVAAGCCNGYFTLMMATKAPEKFEQFLIWQTASWEQNRHFLDTWIDPKMQLRGPDGVAAYSAAKYAATKWWFEISGGPQAEDREMTETAHHAYDHGGCHCLAELVQSSLADPVPKFEKVAVSTTLLWCGSDPTHAKSTPESLLPLLPDSPIIRWEDAGHMPDLEFPDRLVDLIQSL